MLNKVKICVACAGFRMFRNFERTQQTAEVFTSLSPNSFYESECESKSWRHESKSESQRHESKFESSKSRLESDSSPDSDSSLPNSG